MGISPQRRFLMIGQQSRGGELEIEVWDLAARKLVLKRQEPAGIEAIRFDPHRRSFTYDVGDASESATWTELGAAAVRRRQAATGGVDALAFSPDGHWVASVDQRHTVNIRDVAGSTLLHALKGHQHPVQVASFSPDGLTMVSGDASGQLIRWDISTEEKLATWSFNSSLLTAPVPVRAADSTSPASKSLEQTSVVPPSGLTAMTFSPDQSVLAVGTASGYTLTFDLARGTALSPVFHQSPIADVIFAADVASLLVVTESGKVSRWWRSPDPPFLLTQQDGSVRFAALDATGRRAVIGCADRRLKVWDVDQQSLVQTLDNSGEAIAAGTLSPDGRRAVTAGYGSGIVLWDLVEMKSLGKHYGHEKRVWAFDFAPDNNTFASASDDKTVRIWTSGSKKTIRTLELDAAVRFVRFSPDGTRLVTATLDPRGWQFPARLQLWKTETGKPLVEFHGHRMAVNSAVFSHDGKELVSCDAEGQVCRWDIATGKPIGHHQYSVGLSHAGVIASRGLIALRRYSNGVSIIRTRDLTQISAFDVPTRSIGDLNVAARGNRIIAGTEDGAVYIWSLGNE